MTRGVGGSEIGKIFFQARPAGEEGGEYWTARGKQREKGGELGQEGGGEEEGGKQQQQQHRAKQQPDQREQQRQPDQKRRQQQQNRCEPRCVWQGRLRKWESSNQQERPEPKLWKNGNQQEGRQPKCQPTQTVQQNCKSKQVGNKHSREHWSASAHPKYQPINQPNLPRLNNWHNSHKLETYVKELKLHPRGPESGSSSAKWACNTAKGQPGKEQEQWRLCHCP